MYGFNLSGSCPVPGKQRGACLKHMEYVMRATGSWMYQFGRIALAAYSDS